MNPQGQIRRSSTDRMLGGVCGGLGQYLGVDSTIVRLVFVLLVFSGVSPFLYLLLWIVIPSEAAASASWTQQVQQSVGEIRDRATSVAQEVSSQVQRVRGSSDPNPAAPPADSNEGPSTGPTSRL